MIYSGLSLPSCISIPFRFYNGQVRLHLAICTSDSVWEFNADLHCKNDLLCLPLRFMEFWVAIKCSAVSVSGGLHWHLHAKRHIRKHKQCRGKESESRSQHRVAWTNPVWEAIDGLPFPFNGCHATWKMVGTARGWSGSSPPGLRS